MRKIMFKIPEYYVLVLAILAGYTPPFHFNPFLIGIAAIFVLQLIFKNRISGLIIGILFFLINLFFLGALLSEFNEFTEFNNKAKQLIVVGLAIWFTNLVVSLIMIYKYAKNELKRKDLSLTSDIKIKR